MATSMPEGGMLLMPAVEKKETNVPMRNVDTLRTMDVHAMTPEEAHAELLRLMATGTL